LASRLKDPDPDQETDQELSKKLRIWIQEVTEPTEPEQVFVSFPKEQSERDVVLTAVFLLRVMKDFCGTKIMKQKYNTGTYYTFISGLHLSVQ
jgi:hypothetical protein